MHPLLNAIADTRSLLIAGAGGGFDFVSGIPLFMEARRLGRQVVLANLSFSALQEAGCREEYPGTWLVDGDARSLPYFPDKYVLDWLGTKGECPPLYAISNDLGVQPLRMAYASICARHNIDTIVLVDGGTDSLMFGDEPQVGTIVEDACSIAAVSAVMPERSVLAAIGFGVEHDLSHHACLENMASLTAEGHFLGVQALSRLAPEGAEYLELVEYLNVQMPGHESIVTNSIAASMKGYFGNVHATERTGGTVQFVSPLMSVYWFWQLRGVAERLGFRREILGTESMHDVAKAYQTFRLLNRPRARRRIDLK